MWASQTLQDRSRAWTLHLNTRPREKTKSLALTIRSNIGWLDTPHPVIAHDVQMPQRIEQTSNNVKICWIISARSPQRQAWLNIYKKLWYVPCTDAAALDTTAPATTGCSGLTNSRESGAYSSWLRPTAHLDIARGTDSQIGWLLEWTVPWLGFWWGERGRRKRKWETTPWIWTWNT